MRLQEPLPSFHSWTFDFVRQRAAFSDHPRVGVSSLQGPTSQSVSRHGIFHLDLFLSSSHVPVFLLTLARECLARRAGIGSSLALPGTACFQQSVVTARAAASASHTVHTQSGLTRCCPFWPQILDSKKEALPLTVISVSTVSLRIDGGFLFLVNCGLCGLT